jgi:hypothetical protein
MDQSVITQPVPTRVAAPMRRTPPTGQHRMIVAPVEPGLVGDESEFDVPTYIRRQMLQSGE